MWHHALIVKMYFQCKHCIWFSFSSKGLYRSKWNSLGDFVSNCSCGDSMDEVAPQFRRENVLLWRSNTQYTLNLNAYSHVQRSRCQRICFSEVLPYYVSHKRNKNKTKKTTKGKFKKQQLCLATFQSKISCTSIRLWPATVLIHRLLLSLNWVQICVWNKKFGKFAWV